jgi:hypothetical protein
MVAAEELERDQRRAASRRALVLEPSPQELALLPVPELADGAVGDRPDPIVLAPGGRLDLVVPLAAKVRQRALVTGPRELVRARGFARP